MFDIQGTTIYLTRGDKAIIGLTLKDYMFKVGDIIDFKVYNANELNKAPVLSQQVKVEEESEKVNIELSSEKTTIGEILNEQKEYWYEIKVNGEQTPFGYDKKGPKILILYPEGADADATSNELSIG